MTFSVGIKNIEGDEKSDMLIPLYWLNHPITLDLFKAVPVTGKVFYDKDAPGADSDDPENDHPNLEIRHDDPRLTQIKESLDQYLDGYTPPPGDRYFTKASVPGQVFKSREETVPLSQLAQGMELKYATHTLREVVDYSMQNQRNIQVN